MPPTRPRQADRAGRLTARFGATFIVLFLLVLVLVAYQATRLETVRKDYERASFPVTDLANVQRQAERLRSSVIARDADSVELDMRLLERQLAVTSSNARSAEDSPASDVLEVFVALDLLLGDGIDPVFADPDLYAELGDQADLLSIRAKAAYDSREQDFFDLMVAGIDESSRLVSGLGLLGILALLAGGTFTLRVQRGNRASLKASNRQLRAEVAERQAGEQRLAEALAEAGSSESAARRAAAELSILHGVVLAGVGGGVLEVSRRVADELVRLHGFPMIAIILHDAANRPYTAALAGPADTASWVGKGAIVSAGGPLERVLQGAEAVQEAVAPTVITALPRATVMQVAPIHLGGRSVGALVTEVEGEQAPVLNIEALQRLADQIGVLTEAARGYDDQVGLAAKFRELDQLKTEFVATVSHELRTPLTAIVGMAITLDEYWDRVKEPERRDMVSRMRRQARRQQRLVDDLLTISRLQEGGVTVRREVVAVLPLVTSVARDLEVDLVLDVQPDDRVLADRDHVERIITNYVTNAVKYGGGASIDVTVEHHGDTVDLVVSDAGSGVPEAFREQLFDAFTQASMGSTRTSQGVGLGLSIVRTLAIANDGDAWYRPRPGGGSRFGVTLAAAPALAPAAAPVAAAPVAAAPLAEPRGVPGT